jgi:hypothetical protein
MTEEPEERPVGPSTQTPTLVLLPPGIPTVEGLVAMFRALTGRELSPSDVEEARAILASIDEPEPPD